jgi:hypothetical protein
LPRDGSYDSSGSRLSAGSPTCAAPLQSAPRGRLTSRHVHDCARHDHRHRHNASGCGRVFRHTARTMSDLFRVRPNRVVRPLSGPPGRHTTRSRHGADCPSRGGKPQNGLPSRRTNRSRHGADRPIRGARLRNGLPDPRTSRHVRDLQTMNHVAYSDLRRHAPSPSSGDHIFHPAAPVARVVRCAVSYLNE